MKTVIDLSARDRAALFSATARALGFGTDVIVEKDFWVCWTLQQLFNEIAGYGPRLVFKGGTSLSKVYGAIKRFSEDVDITLGRELLGLRSDDHDPEKAPSGNQKRRRIEVLRLACSHWVAGDLKQQLEAKTREALGEGGWSYAVDEADEDRLTLLFRYPSVLGNPQEGGYIPRSVKIECGAKADIWPVTQASIQPYVAEAFPAQITGASVAVRALAIERTFWEKATILHAEALRPPGKPFKANFARHYADTAALADHPGGKCALSDAELRRRVVAFKDAFYHSSWSSYDTAAPGTFMLLPAAAHMDALERDYRHMQREMSLVNVLGLLALFMSVGVFVALVPAHAVPPWPLLLMVPATIVVYFAVMLVAVFRTRRKLLALELSGTAVAKHRPVEYRSRAEFLGMPLVHVRLGESGAASFRIVKAWIALGDVACGGLFAYGGIAVAPISFGGITAGLFTIGGVSVGAVSVAGVALGALAFGGQAIGWIASGGCALGSKAAYGGLAWAREFAAGGMAKAAHANDSVANAFFAHGIGALARGIIDYVGWIGVLGVVPLVIWLIQGRSNARRAPFPQT